MNKARWTIVSGGQTGVDRAALVAAMTAGLPFGGWIPNGRMAEDGIVPEIFNTMQEVPYGGYRARTQANVDDSDATLILVDTLPLTGGTAYTETLARDAGRPYLVVNLEEADALHRIHDWMCALECLPSIGSSLKMNVAGPRESNAPGIFEKAKAALEKIFQNVLD